MYDRTPKRVLKSVPRPAYNISGLKIGLFKIISLYKDIIFGEMENRPALDQYHGA